MANIRFHLGDCRSHSFYFIKWLIGFFYLIIGTPGSKSKIIAFVIHEVGDTPNGHARLTQTYTSRANFLKQISLLSAYFEFLNPVTDPLWSKKTGCLITFDDGYRGSLEAAKILEAQEIASIHLVNLETVSGEINSSALLHFKSFESGKKVDWSESTPKNVRELSSDLTESELRNLIDFSGPYLNANELAELQSLHYSIVGDHFTNHWYGNSLIEREVVENLSLGIEAHYGASDLKPFFAAPHGVLDLDRIKLISNRGYEVVFTGHTWTTVGNTTVIPRIDLNNSINSKFSLFGAIAVLVLKSRFKSKN
jgi:hypothetical protein